MNEGEDFSFERRDKLAWAAIGVTVFINLLNFVIFLVFYFIDLKRAVREWKANRVARAKLASIQPCLNENSVSILTPKSQFSRSKNREVPSTFENSMLEARLNKRRGSIVIDKKRESIQYRERDRLRNIRIDCF